MSVLFIKVFGILLQFIAIFIITNNASEVLFGKFNFMSYALILCGAICLLGMNNSFLQFSGKLQAQNDFNQVVSLYKRMFVILISNFIVILLFYKCLSDWFRIEYFEDEDVKNLFDKVIFVLCPYTVSILNFQVLRGLNLLYMSEIASNIFRFGGLLILSLVLYALKDYSYLIEGYIFIFYLISFVTTLIIIFQLIKLKSKSLVKIGYKEIVKTSIPMSFSLITLLMMQSFDVFILEKYWSFEQVAFYGAAVKITTGIGIILTTINAVIAPDISKLYFSHQYQKLKVLIVKSTMLNFYLTIPAILFIFLFSENILALFGKNYVIANSALVLMIIAQMFNAFCGSVGVYLNMTGRQKVYLFILVLALMLNIILNLIFIPQYGMFGAAAATGISMIFWNVTGVIYIYRKDKIGVFILSKYLT
ncbi:MATE family efflux transporter [Psychroserpens damuponensis]|uniref:MATE family efflux transporter n=1 Tax=Psychroserpens damuponensis TaxID=943936 RepID=UPI00058D8C72|nr:MATE family efflux transporter [Psychroserpens damuponensis]